MILVTLDKEHYEVYSNTNMYEITLKYRAGRVDSAKCTCPAYKYSKVQPRTCKHIAFLSEEQNIQWTENIQKRYKRSLVDKLITQLNVLFLAQVDHKIAGSYRRGSESIKDLDIVINGDEKFFVHNYLQEFYPNGGDILPGDDRRLSGIESTTRNTILRWRVPVDNQNLIQLDFFFATPSTFEPALLYFTGNRDFNIYMRGAAKRQGKLLNQNGLFVRDSYELIANTEKDIFAALDIPYRLPKDRNFTFH